MDIGDIVSDAVKYPSTDWKKVIILGILFVISFLIVPAFFAMGYTFRALKASIAGSDELPEFDEWGDMFIDGLKVFIVNIAYFIIPFIVIFIGTWASISSMIAVSGAGTVANPTIFLGLVGITVIIGIMLAIIFGLLALIAIANMALYDSELGAAFRFSEILERIAMIGWGKYIIWYIVMIVIGLVAGVIVGILNIIPIIGLIIALIIIYPYLYLLFFRSTALIFASSEDEAVEE
jgi:hypothetical protein